MDENTNASNGVRDRIFSLLESEDISQKEFAELLGTSPQTITDWKKGKSRSFYQRLPLIASILHCDISWLTDGIGDKIGSEKDDKSFDRILHMAYTSRFVQYDGAHVNPAEEALKENTFTDPKAGEREKEFVQLFRKLTSDQQNLVLAQLQGIVASQDK